MLLHFAWVVDDAKCIVVTRVCVSVCLCVCLSVRGRTPTLHGPGCNFGAQYRLPPSCALLGGFAIGARFALLWQHNANPSYKLASIPRYDDMRTAVWVGSAHAGGRWLAGEGGAFSKLCAVYRKWAFLACRWLAVDGGRSQHYCGSLDCGLPLVAFWQHNANAKC